MDPTQKTPETGAAPALTPQEVAAFRDWQKAKDAEAEEAKRMKGKIKIKLLMPAKIGKKKDDPICEAGTEHVVTEAEAEELLRPIAGNYSFSGIRKRGDETPRHNMARAVRVA